MAEHAAVASVITAIGKNRVGVTPDVMGTNQVVEKTSSSLQLIHFNISGQKFIVSNQLIDKFPTSKFHFPSILAENWLEEEKIFYFDRDPALFNTVLNVFRYDVLSIPSGYDKGLIKKELDFWWVPSDNLNIGRSQEEKRLEAEFQWLENRIPPPPANSKRWIKLRYKAWCFLTDPLGPYTSWRKLSFACCILTVCLTLVYMILFGLGTSVHYREHEGHDKNMNETTDTQNNLAATTEALGCTALSKIDCYLRTTPKDWIHIGKSVIMTMFVAETILRLLLCPGQAYFKSLITWMDIVAGICAIVVMVLIQVEDKIESHFGDDSKKSARYVQIMLDSAQVLRVFKIFQYASVIDGLMIMILTLKACLKELLLLVMYLLIAMFLFSTLIFFAELQAHTGTGIPDATLGYWWSIVTMTTVGYGDYYPTTTAGYFIGVLCSITGIILTALPVAVIGSNFNIFWEHNNKRRSSLMESISSDCKSKEIL
ncbi:potassium voltage-gated channel protein egl-36-like [Watersipora subatra]|uniref:potassium voltage-gated channel protein egl-36-like n=1 Tax=Watersipora subatra TaxID=2589382 RepID=UPI00355C0D0C